MHRVERKLDVEKWKMLAQDMSENGAEGKYGMGALKKQWKILEKEGRATSYGNEVSQNANQMEQGEEQDDQ
jgi:hypothetical protein